MIHSLKFLLFVSLLFISPLIRASADFGLESSFRITAYVGLTSHSRGEAFLTLKPSLVWDDWEARVEILMGQDSDDIITTGMHGDFKGEDDRQSAVSVGECLLQWHGRFSDWTFGKFHPPRGVAEALNPTEFLERRDLSYPLGEKRLLPVPGVLWEWERGPLRGWAALTRAASHRYPPLESTWSPLPVGFSGPLPPVRREGRWQEALAVEGTFGPLDLQLLMGRGVDTALHLQGRRLLYPAFRLLGLNSQLALGAWAFHLESAGRWFSDDGIEDWASTVGGLERSLTLPWTRREVAVALEVQAETHLGGPRTLDQLRLLDPQRIFEKALYVTLTSQDINTWDVNWTAGWDGEGAWMLDASFTFHMTDRIALGVELVTLDAPGDHMLHPYTGNDYLRLTMTVHLPKL